MPRRKSVDQSAPVRKRARTGCLTCRSRKVKCDEMKPRCRNCSRRGLTCDTGVQLKWEQEFSSRGLAFGRQGRWSKDRTHGSPATPASTPQALAGGYGDPAQWCLVPLVQGHHFINSFYYDFDLDSCGEDIAAKEGTSEAEVTVASSPLSISTLDSQTLVLLDGLSLSRPPTTTCTLALSRSPSPFPSLISIDSSLLEYYLLRLCPLTIPSRLASSPFAQLIMPLFGLPGQEDVQKAVMALSARHRSATDSAWSKTAMALKGSVITSLRRRLLAAGSNGSDVIWDPQILIIMMFLCLYEIVDNCDHRWVIHLRASEDIIRRRRQIAQSHVHRDFGDLTTFTDRFFAFQDVISRTACGNSPLFGIEYWDNASRPTDIDSWMGCSPALVKVLCRITELSQLKAREDIPPPDFERQSADLEMELYQMRQPAGTMDVKGDTLAAAAELKRRSVLLYHHCVLYDASPSTPFVCESVRDILQGLHELVVCAGVTAGLAFPLFVAAVELDPVDDQLFSDKRTGELVHGRRLVLETLEDMGRCSLSNISRTRAVIQKVWRTRDMALDEDGGGGSSRPRRGGRGRGETNDWSTFVGPFSSNISLA